MAEKLTPMDQDMLEMRGRTEASAAPGSLRVTVARIDVDLFQMTGIAVKAIVALLAACVLLSPLLCFVSFVALTFLELLTGPPFPM